MISIEGNELIRGHSPQAVFEAGRQADTLPTLDVMALATEDKIITEGSDIEVAIFLPIKLPIIGRDGLKIPTKVTELQEAEKIAIHGETNIVRTALLIQLEKRRRGKDTLVTHSLEVELMVVKGMMARFVERAARSELDNGVDAYRGAHIENICARLQSAPTPLKKSNPTAKTKRAAA